MAYTNISPNPLYSLKFHLLSFTISKKYGRLNGDSGLLLTIGQMN